VITVNWAAPGDMEPTDEVGKQSKVSTSARGVESAADESAVSVLAEFSGSG